MTFKPSPAHVIEARRELARRSLVDFTAYTLPGYDPAPHHYRIAEHLEAVERGEIDRLMVFMPPRHGKEIAHSTPVLTPSGWTTHGDLRPGDKVYHPSGVPVDVVAIAHDEHEDRCVVEFTNGERIRCHENHEWTVFDRTVNRWRTVETGYWLEQTKFGKPRQCVSGRRSIYQLPDIDAVRAPDADLPLPAYFVGAWLGDGTTGDASIVASPNDLAPIERIQALGLTSTSVTAHKATGVLKFGFGGYGIRAALRTLGALSPKRIPTPYMTASVEQRLDLMAGLVDTDGHVNASGRVRIVTASEDLAADIFDLAEGLGFRPYLTRQAPSLSSSGIQGRRDVLTVGFQPTMAIPTAIERKRIKRLAPRRRIGIKSVTLEPTGEKGRCIQVSSPDGLYLVGKRLIPTHNSELASRRFPAWLLGRDPGHQIIASSYNSDLATDFGREVREIVNSPEYGEVFPNVSLKTDDKAANRWKTNHRGAYYAVGVGTAATGRGAKTFLIDDPFKDREEADSELRRERVWNWYRSTAYTRLAPGGRVVLVNCMTGGTPVLMADGSQKRLDAILPGEAVASYDGARIVPQKVLNWANQGPDNVFAIKTKSGRVVRANARHPFLILKDGEEAWTRVRDLSIGDKVLSLLGIGASGEASHAPRKGATRPPVAKACVARATARKAGQTGNTAELTSNSATHTLEADTASARLIMTPCCQVKAASVLSAKASASEGERQPNGGAISALTIAMTRARFAACSVMTAIWRWATPKQNQSPAPALTIYEITADEIVEIVADGFEDVFDIEVESTSNFVANGLLSHNTRWHDDDLSGRLLEAMDDGADQWEILSLPAIDDGGKALWPGWYPIERLRAIEKTIGPREWSALYQQKPQPDDGTYFKREWFNRYAPEDLPKSLNKYATSDYAVTDGGGDWTVHRIWGVDSDGDIWLLDGWRGQTSADQWIEEKLNLAEKHRPYAWFGEAGVIAKAVEPMLTRRMRERGVYFRMEWITSINDKAARARGFQARAAMGKVWIPEGYAGDQVLDEYLRFPAGKHDDEVDVAGLIGRALDDAHPAVVTTQATTAKKERYARTGNAGVDWKTA